MAPIQRSTGISKRFRAARPRLGRTDSTIPLLLRTPGLVKPRPSVAAGTARWPLPIFATAVLYGLALVAQQGAPALGGGDSHPAVEWVGTRVDPARIRFNGLKSFSERDLRSALVQDVQFIQASHPSSLPADFLESLPRRLAAGRL